MKKSALLKKGSLFCGLAGLCMASPAFSLKTDTDTERLVSWSNKCLLHCFDPDTGGKLKKWDLILTPDYFLRFKKYYQGGKQEYYSFHVRRFKDVNYLGTTSAGTLRFYTNADDIIVQTYNDPKGNIDSMATSMDIPLRAIEPEQLDSLRTAFLQLKSLQH